VLDGGRGIDLDARPGRAARAAAHRRTGSPRAKPGSAGGILREVLLRNGLDPTAAEAICRQASRDPEQALGVYSRAVLGVNPAELGSPWASAFSSLVTFAAGAFVPLAPWLVATGPKVALISFALGLGRGGRHRRRARLADASPRAVVGNATGLRGRARVRPDVLGGLALGTAAS
jgi:hypothetical protein